MKTLSILVPVYNEAPTVAALLERVTRVDLAALGLAREILVVDDGSTDDGAARIERFQREHPAAPVRLLRHAVNLGKGAAVRTALAVATGDICLIQDADLEYDPADYPLLLRPLLAGVSRVVYGSRWLAPRIPISGPLYALGGWLENKFLRLLYRTNITDIATCYKVIDTALLRDLRLESTGFEFCPEVTAKLLNRRETIVEVPIRYDPRHKRDGKKIRWTDFFIALYTLCRVRFQRR